MEIPLKKKYRTVSRQKHTQYSPRTGNRAGNNVRRTARKEALKKRREYMKRGK